MPGTSIEGFLQIADFSEASLFQAIWENFPENMFLIRVDEAADDFVIEAINPAQATTLSALCQGKSVHEVLPRATADRVVARYRECLGRAGPIRYEEGDVTYFDPSGAQRMGSWLTLLMPLHDGDGRISHLFGISQDITELRLARSELERQNQELEGRVAERTAELRQANEQLSAVNAELERLASRDYLTGVHNRRNLELLVEHELHRANRVNHPLTLLMLDLDGFKAINDEQGHGAGDALLQRVASTMQAHLRSVDLLGRYGGDEFMIVLPDTELVDAEHVANRIRHDIRRECGVTVSIGLARSLRDDFCLDNLALRADTLLMDAKRSGRDTFRSAN
ncbi:diguanylate cyclase [Aquisalimonas lutea]|uniref:GGDEF domain-containing protein n=1 Tax=Aquisalimonas lutea TaxID=1327750 RepID=UPI0025B580F7|nr:diguanylate cyclase [Aquisalimonas lutea]MDN3519705.1 diguanylate cyclase [Aquisalimonas lutea]